jgi:hypothetical protein
MKKRILGVSMALVLIAVMALPMAVLAQESDTGDSTVTGDVGSYYTIVVPATIDFNTLSLSGENSGEVVLSVATNDLTQTTVTITAQDAVNAGVLTSGSNTLSTALRLQVTGQPAVPFTNTDPITLITDASLSSNGDEKIWGDASNLTFIQPAFTAVAASDYTTTITFTATFN